MSGRLVLVRHGQSHSNVERCLDTRPPGAALTPAGIAQARDFAHGFERHAGMLVHSVALRASQTAAVIGGVWTMPPHETEGLHEVQVGELEMRNDDEAVEVFNRVYERWHLGELDVALPGGETGAEVLDRYLPVLTDLRMRYLDDDSWNGDIVVVSHGAAIRLAAATLAGVAGVVRGGAPHRQRRVGGAGPDHRRTVELRAVGPAQPAVHAGSAGHATARGAGVRRPDGLSGVRPPARWTARKAADRIAVDAQRVCDATRAPSQSSSVHSARRCSWMMTVPWQCSHPSRQ